MNTNLSEKGNALILVIIIMAVVVAAIIYTNVLPVIAAVGNTLP